MGITGGVSNVQTVWAREIAHLVDHSANVFSFSRKTLTSRVLLAKVWLTPRLPGAPAQYCDEPLAVPHRALFRVNLFPLLPGGLWLTPLFSSVACGPVPTGLRQCEGDTRADTSDARGECLVRGHMEQRRPEPCAL